MDTSIYALACNNTEITDEIKTLIRSHSIVREVDIGGLDVATCAPLRVFAESTGEFPKLTTFKLLNVNFSSCDWFDQFVTKLASCTSLSSLSLEACHINSVQFSALIRLGGVSSLALDSNDIDGLGLKAISSDHWENRAVRCLYLNHNPMLGDDGMKFICEHFLGLSRLYMKNNGITKVGTTYLGQLVKTKNPPVQLEVLDLSDNAIGDEGVCSIFPNESTLNIIYLSYTGISNLSMFAIASNPTRVRFVQANGNANITDHGCIWLVKKRITASLQGTSVTPQVSRLCTMQHPFLSDGENRFIEERCLAARLMILLSVRSIPHVGPNSPLKGIPSDILREILMPLLRPPEVANVTEEEAEEE